MATHDDEVTGDFIILDGPHTSHNPATDQFEWTDAEETLRQFQQLLQESFASYAIVPTSTVLSPQTHTLPPAAEGWAHLFDLAPFIRPIIDDIMRVAFVGGALWATVNKIKAWQMERTRTTTILLSASMVRAICEFRTRQHYQITGPVKVHSVVYGPWSPGPSQAGVYVGERHHVWIHAENGVTYEYVTDSSAEILTHVVVGEPGVGIREAILESDRLLPIVDDLKSRIYSSDGNELEAVMRELTSVAVELSMIDDERWLRGELTNDMIPPAAGIRYQRFEHATKVMFENADPPKYRIVSGLSESVSVTISDPPIDTRNGHRYLVQFYLGVPMRDLVDQLADLNDWSKLDEPALRVRITAPPLPELADVPLIDVDVSLRDIQQAVTGFRQELGEFAERSYRAAILERAERDAVAVNALDAE